MKRIKMLFAVALICAMGTVGYNSYADANMTAQERLLLENIEALTSGEDEDFKCKIDKDPCIISVSSSADIAILKKLGFGSATIGGSVNLTRVYVLGGKSRCGTDKTCYDVFQ